MQPCVNSFFFLSCISNCENAYRYKSTAVVTTSETSVTEDVSHAAFPPLSPTGAGAYVPARRDCGGQPARRASPDTAPCPHMDQPPPAQSSAAWCTAALLVSRELWSPPALYPSG
jgi:hypothetical protein